MRRWLYYHILVLLDLVRLWPSVQQHVIIVAGICLPILMLLGLKNGHVAELRKELLKSPSGRQIVFWAAQRGELLKESRVDTFAGELGGVDLIIPEIQRVVGFDCTTQDGSHKTIDNVTLYSTRPGDPILAQHGADLLKAGEDAVILAKEVADSLGVREGDVITLTAQRMQQGRPEKAKTLVQVKRVLPLDSAIGYADVALLTAIEQYVQGFQVKRFDWPAIAATAADEYTAYLIICEKSDPLTDEDIRTLTERGYIVDAVDDLALRRLYGLLMPESLEKLVLYRMAARGAREQWQRLKMGPSEIAKLTAADDVVIPWNEPKMVSIDGVAHRLVGFSLPRRTWLGLYMAVSDESFSYDTETFSVMLADGEGSFGPQNVRVSYGERLAISAQVIPRVEKPTSKPETAPAGGSQESSTLNPEPESSHALPVGGTTVSGPTSPSSDLVAETTHEQSLEVLKSTLGRVTDQPTASPTGSDKPADEQPTSDTAPNPTPSEEKREFQDSDSGAESKGPVKEGVSETASAAIAPPVTEVPVPDHTSRDQVDGTTVPGDEKADRAAAPDAGTASSAIAKEGLSAGSNTAALDASASPPSTEKAGGSTSSDLSPTERDSSPSLSRQTGELPLAVAPVDLLAYLHAYEAGRVEYDASLKLFVPTPREAIFDRARLYAATIDEVPVIVEQLKSRGFAVMSESTRINEIHQQDFSLKLLVLIVGVGVFVFGVVTVIMVLLESTDRKRGTIGILRVMGMPRAAIFYTVFLRAAIIGAVAAAVTLTLGFAASSLLAWTPPEGSSLAFWKPVIRLIITPYDLALVVAGALACCSLGSMMPAMRASRIDPFDAIVEGRFR